MKRIYLLLCFFLSLFSVSAQSGEWTWLHGSNTINSLGKFGVQGLPSPTNDPPALYEACEWTDLNGKFWMYGGIDNNSEAHVHNDLWKYDPVDSEWTWVSGTNAVNDSGNFGIRGVASPSNRPPSIAWGASSWVDLNGNLWMFGGCFNNTLSGSQSNLWKYDIGANEWTWIKGPGLNIYTGIYGTQGVSDTANYPPGRSECAAAWTDNTGDLWLFGGYVGALYNDMWRYNIASNTWTWMKGSDSLSQKGFWGTMGIEDPANVPSSRWAYSHWKDNADNLWMFGGSGLDSTGVSAALSDLWRYNHTTNNWTWMNGRNVFSASHTGVYGTKCVMSSSNQPPPRYEHRAVWSDMNGNFWVFGGKFQTSAFNSSTLNDLWMYCVTSNQWIWESGDSIPNGAGNWGTLGVARPSNEPSPRMGCPGWTDNKGNLYLFGGSSASFSNFYNDLWEFRIDTACAHCQEQPLAVASLPISNPIYIYPNPATNQLTIHTSSFQNEAVTVLIFNLLGQQTSPPIPLHVERGVASIDVSRLPSGMYFLRLKSAGGSFVEKFVKE